MNLNHLKRNTKITNLLILIGLIIIPVAYPKIATGINFKQFSRNVQISASVPDNYLTLTGYSSANAKIKLESTDTFSLTYSNQDGFFKFDHILLPKSSNEICLTSSDSNLRESPPLCLPPVPPSKTINNIGPVLLPPTISLDTANVDPYSTNYISGESIPNSPINIHLYKSFSFPILSTQSDKDGHYSFSIPTTYSGNYRLFSSVNFQNNPSPKSNTLNYKLPFILSSVNTLSIGIFSLIVILFISFIVIFYNQRKSCQKPTPTDR